MLRLFCCRHTCFPQLQPIVSPFNRRLIATKETVLANRCFCYCRNITTDLSSNSRTGLLSSSCSKHHPVLRHPTMSRYNDSSELSWRSASRFATSGYYDQQQRPADRMANRPSAWGASHGGDVGVRMSSSQASVGNGQSSSNDQQRNSVVDEYRSRTPFKPQRVNMAYNKLMELRMPGKAVYYFKNVYSLLRQLGPPSRPVTQPSHSSSYMPPTVVKAPSFDFRREDDVWVCKVHVFYPYEKIFEGYGTNKRNAEGDACFRGIYWLRDQSVIAADLKPAVQRDEERKQLMEKVKDPIEIKPLHNDVKAKMMNFVAEYESNIRYPLVDIVQKLTTKTRTYSAFDEDGYRNEVNEWSRMEDNVFNEEAVNGSDKVFDILTGRPLLAEDRTEMSTRLVQYTDAKRSSFLKEFLEMRNQSTDKQFIDMKHRMSEMPIYRYKERILETIARNSVTVISGETGCGKTTQLPQFILEDFIRRGRGAACSIVITQPRRLPAIAVAEQVAYQFGEKEAGGTIGYHVRFEKNLPSYNKGAMLFCTAGILLRKLENNPELTGVSHVIVDEVHERDVVVDFLLVLLKRLIQRNRDIRVVLMSASINAHLFSEYFNSSPIIEIPGRLFPVQKMYMPEINQMIQWHENEPAEFNPKIRKDYIVHLIQHIDRTRPDGAILCFLPGWGDIQDIGKLLEDKTRHLENLLVLPVHSKLPHSTQKLIFKRPPSGVRKVVLSTNITETSLTIDDIVYVIDPGLCNEIHYSEKFNVSTFGTHWISRANAIQREGRAGRVQPGECFKLYSMESEKRRMNEYPVPEILRIPLETVVMQCKLYCQQERAEYFLSAAPQPPSAEALSSAIRTLKAISLLDESENLTALGKRVVHFTTHPRMSVSLVLATMLGCLTPMLNVVAMLSVAREPFQVLPDERSRIREIKKAFTTNHHSDHLALARIAEEFERIDKYEGHTRLQDYVNRNFLHFAAMNNVMELKKTFINHLYDAKMIERKDYEDYRFANINNESDELILAALVCGVYPNLIRFSPGELSKVRSRSLTRINVVNGNQVRFASDGLLSKDNGARNRPLWQNVKVEPDEDGAPYFAGYFNSFYSEDARRLTIKDSSKISPLSLIIFAGQSFTDKEDTDPNKIIVVIDENEHLRFRINRSDLQQLLTWKTILCTYFHYFVVSNHGRLMTDRVISESMVKFINITKDLLASQS